MAKTHPPKGLSVRQETPEEAEEAERQQRVVHHGLAMLFGQHATDDQLAWGKVYVSGDSHDLHNLVKEYDLYWDKSDVRHLIQAASKERMLTEQGYARAVELGILSDWGPQKSVGGRGYLTLAKATERFFRQMDKARSEAAWKSIICRAIKKGVIKTNGASHRKSYISKESLDALILLHRNRALKEDA